MNNLLDTHTLIWFLNGDKNLSAKAKKSIETTDALNFISIASLWEIAIKISIERLTIQMPFEKNGEEIANNNFQLLPVTFKDTIILSSLPFHHRDPFDRMIIAQTLSSDLTLISKDKAFNDYKIKLLW